MLRAYRPVFANTIAAQILGFDTRDELLSRLSLLSCFDERTQANPDAAEAESLSGYRQGRTQWRRRNGDPIWISYASRPILWNDAPSLVFAFADITEVQRAQAEALQAKNRADAALEARARFLSAASHHLRTPLHGVIGRLSLLTDGQPPEAVRQLSLDALHDARRMLVQIDDILDAAALATEAPHWARDSFDLADAVDDALQIVAGPGHRTPADIRVDAPLPGVVQICGDRRRFSRIILAMLDEALRLSVDRVVGLSVRSQPGAATVAVHTATDPAQPITALPSPICAMTLAKHLAQALGGQCIAVTDETGRWTATANLPADPNVEPQFRADADLQPLRVLAAEDNPGNRHLIGLILKHLGCEAVLVSNGAEAVDALAVRPADVVLMDLMMPVLDGYEATRRIRAAGWAWSDVPIVAMTADSSSHARSKAEAAGVDAFLTKPVDVRRLASTLMLLTSTRPAPEAADGADALVHPPEINQLQRQHGQQEHNDHGDRDHGRVSGTARRA